MQLLSSIYPFCAAAVAISSEEDKQSRAEVGVEASASYSILPSNETGTGPVTKTALCFEVDFPDAMTVSPPWVNTHDSTIPSMPSSVFLGSSYPQDVEAKVSASSLSGGSFIVPSLSPNKLVRGGSVFFIDLCAT